MPLRKGKLLSQLSVIRNAQDPSACASGKACVGYMASRKRYYVIEISAIPEPLKECIFRTICSKTLEKKQFQNPRSVPETVCCRPFWKRPIWGVPEWVCCGAFWNGQKQSVLEHQKNNVLGTLLVLKTVFFGHSRILKKQRFQNPQKTMIEEC